MLRGSELARAEAANQPALTGLPNVADPRPRRSPKWIALGVIAVCLGALGSYYLFMSTTESHRVVAVRQAVARGAVLRSGDLTVVSVGSTHGIPTVDGDQLANLVGRRTSVQLVPDTLLPPQAVSADPLPATNRTIVGVRLVDGRAPAGFLEPGSPVRLIAVASTNPDAGTREGSDSVTVTARVVDVRPLPDGQSVLLNADVPAAQAATVARLAAADRLVCLRDAEG